MSNKKHFLFICTSSIDRSPCAEALFEDSEEIEARSAGFFPIDSSKKITIEKIRWASTIFVMDERKEFHKTQLLQRFPEAEEKEIVVLNISNEFCRNDEELKRRLIIGLEREGIGISLSKRKVFNISLGLCIYGRFI